MNPTVDVLLASYEGEKYLEEQIDSIFAQTYPHFHLWIRDDYSSDQTLRVLHQLANRYPSRITLLPGEENLGIVQNFAQLLKKSTAPYVCFADQDDKWLPHKLEKTLARMQDLEKEYGASAPLLVHTDLTVVEKDLSLIHPSFWRYMKLNPQKISLNRLLTQNILTGCTLMLNRTLVNLVHPIPNQVIMHDWWVGLVAVCLGHIGVVEESTLLYRQHGGNSVGAKRFGIKNFFQQSGQESQKKSECADQTYSQAQLLLEHYSTLLPLEKITILNAYIELKRLPFFRKKQQILKYRFFKQGLLRNLKAFLT